jgi:hypothetical protein
VFRIRCVILRALLKLHFALRGKYSSLVVDVMRYDKSSLVQYFTEILFKKVDDRAVSGLSVLSQKLSITRGGQSLDG